MKCIEILMNEHGVIRKVLKILSFALEKLELGEKPPRKFFENGLDLIQNFVQNYHHCKEEYVLFEMLSKKRNNELINQIGSLKYQHERERQQISEIKKALNGYEKGNDIQRIRLIENLAAYISLQKLHLHWEDTNFYPTAKQEITEKEEQLLLEDFKKEDRKSPTNMIEKSDILMSEMESLI
ncbi:MAG: hypothetical protein A2161_07675 [Candidatus Schekmanbacteria bacterium RBG_13_48_7]|uniref:Hemerythrin-like domain-containing protein n=1 Tax=Candidatus Schekmanbacteria bacterium RBG_13_48_7 TaxID=1817878 RepID=A0A1F7S4N2_9BACT|nr:MAG: hypothetical protein A2161_07675 [Candidatus Schekmanbacteria bacterium RBG_13_48_7]